MFCYPFSPPVIKVFFGIFFNAAFHFEKHSMKLHKPKKKKNPSNSQLCREIPFWAKRQRWKISFHNWTHFHSVLHFSFKSLFLRPPVVSLMCFNPFTQQKVAWESHSRSAFCALSKGMSHDLRSERCSCYSLYDVRDVRFWFECRFNVKQHEFYRRICSAEAAPLFAAVTHTFDCFGFCRQCTLKCFFSCTLRF